MEDFTTDAMFRAGETLSVETPGLPPVLSYLLFIFIALSFYSTLASA
jgi:hypothetical protein